MMAALASVLAVIFITIFIFQSGLPLFRKVSVGEFLFSTNWAPTAKEPHYGIFSFILGSIYVTGLALAVAVPVGFAVGIYLAELAGRRTSKIMRSAVELLASIPSVIYGLFGIAFLAPLVRNTLGGSGYSLLSASLVLAIMTLPTIISVTEVTLRSVPRDLKEGSLALGATHWQTIVHVLLPAGRSDPDHEHHHRHELRDRGSPHQPFRDRHRPFRLHPAAEHFRPALPEALDGRSREVGEWITGTPTARAGGRKPSRFRSSGSCRS